MKHEAVERIKRMMTPKVIIESCQDTPDGKIRADIRHEYIFPEPTREHEEPIKWGKVFTILADKDGNVYSAPGAL